MALKRVVDSTTATDHGDSKIVHTFIQTMDMCTCTVRKHLLVCIYICIHLTIPKTTET